MKKILSFRTHLKNIFKSEYIFKVGSGFLLAAILTVFVGSTHIASAQFLATVGLSAFTKGISVILFACSFIGSLLVQLGGVLTGWALNLNSDVIHSAIVQTGWVITRDVANLGFVLALILIAFTTMLRIESYRVKDVLWKLIVAALLINFSLVIAGLLLDFAGSFTQFFVDASTNGNPSGIGQALTNASKVHTLLQTKTGNDPSFATTFANIGNNFSSQMNFVGSLFFIMVLNFVTASTFIGLAVMLLIRYVWLNLLLILMPLVWLLWIWPDFSSLWSKWWSFFFKWTFFAPITTFFIYLALTVARQSNEGAFSLVKDSSSGLGLGIQDFAGTVGQMTVVVFILLGGLLAAQELGIHGAAGALNISKGIGKNLGLYPATATKFYAGKLSKLDARMQKIKNPVLRKVLRTVAAPFTLPARGITKAIEGGGAIMPYLDYTPLGAVYGAVQKGLGLKSQKPVKENTKVQKAERQKEQLQKEYDELQTTLAQGVVEIPNITITAKLKVIDDETTRLQKEHDETPNEDKKKDILKRLDEKAKERIATENTKTRALTPEAIEKMSAQLGKVKQDMERADLDIKIAKEEHKEKKNKA
ncbi:MAG: hypothetical protein Q8R26_01445 [bacterium]|nr:hypothetical protein [bacterium]